jgi:uncharacterized protein (TIGR02391 family)
VPNEGAFLPPPMRIGDFIPPAPQALKLPLDELALRLLRYFARRGIPNRHNLTLVDDYWRDYDFDGLDLEMLRAAQEAWDWLVASGCLSRDPKRGADWAFVTRRGQELLTDEGGLAKIRAERRVDVDLHPRLEGRVRPQFLLGEFELAAFAAMREVEIRVRKLSGASETDIGVALMQRAFRAEGPLADTSAPKAERDAKMFLFSGAIGLFKNPSSHREVDFNDPTIASEVVLLADLLLRLLDR